MILLAMWVGSLSFAVRGYYRPDTVFPFFAIPLAVSLWVSIIVGISRLAS